MSSVRHGFDAFQLENLEPRVLLSAAPADAPHDSHGALSTGTPAEVVSLAYSDTNPLSDLAPDSGLPGLLADTGPLPSLAEPSHDLPLSSTPPPTATPAAPKETGQESPARQIRRPDQVENTSTNANSSTPEPSHPQGSTAD
jgi:hypothetical protein